MDIFIYIYVQINIYIYLHVNAHISNVGGNIFVNGLISNSAIVNMDLSNNIFFIHMDIHIYIYLRKYQYVYI
jgi:hypothetical protein